MRFRRALSLAINRDEINELVFFGVGKPRSATIVSTNSYFKQEWEQAYAQHDPERASALLDEIGLTERDADGFRIRPDGEPFLQILEHSNEADVPVLELYKEHFAAVGLKTEVRFRGDLWQRHNAGTDNIYSGTISSAEFREYTDAAKATEYELRLLRRQLGHPDQSDTRPGERRQDPRRLRRRQGSGRRAAGHREGVGRRRHCLGQQRLRLTRVHRSVPEGLRPARRAPVSDPARWALRPPSASTRNRLANYPTFYKPEATWPGDLLTSADKLFIRQ